MEEQGLAMAWGVQGMPAIPSQHIVPFVPCYCPPGAQPLNPACNSSLW